MKSLSRSLCHPKFFINSHEQCHISMHSTFFIIKPVRNLWRTKTVEQNILRYSKHNFQMSKINQGLHRYNKNLLTPVYKGGGK